VSFSCVEGTTAFSPQPGLGSYLASLERLLQSDFLRRFALSIIADNCNFRIRKRPQNFFFTCICQKKAVPLQPNYKLGLV